ncbi:MAG: hypothetical protein AB8G96_12570 [Phycisphaerales bacterium]
MSLVDRFNELPRAIRWAIAAAVFFVGFQLWDTTIRPMGAEWTNQGDRIERMARQVRDGEALENRIARQQVVLANLGPVGNPLTETAGRLALNDIVSQRVKSYPSVTGDQFTLNGSTEVVKQAVARQVLKNTDNPNRKLGRITGDLKFNAFPEEAAAIVAELESLPEVRSVTAVRLRAEDRGMISATITIDAWVLVERN